MIDQNKLQVGVWYRCLGPGVKVKVTSIDYDRVNFELEGQTNEIQHYLSQDEFCKSYVLC